MPDLLIEVGCEELPSTRLPRDRGAGARDSSPPRWPPLGLEGGPRRRCRWRRAGSRCTRAGLPAELRRPAPRTVRGPAAEAAFGPDGAPTKAARGLRPRPGRRGGGPGRARGAGPRVRLRRASHARAAPVDELVPEVAARLIVRPALLQDHALGRRHRACASRGRCAGSSPSSTSAPCPSSCTACTAGDVSQGHRFLGGPATIGSASGYDAALRAVAVVASHEAGGPRSSPASTRPPRRPGGAWSDPGGKLEEVVFLVEWPSVITGRFDERHLRLPPRVLVTAMQGHQRYFPLRGRAAATCCRSSWRSPTATRPTPTSSPAATRTCSTRACRTPSSASTATCEAGLAALDARLDAIVFHKRLGTMAAEARPPAWPGSRDLADAPRGRPGDGREPPAQAARLAKADQGAVLVAEFSELEGYVAAEYARREGVARRGRDRGRGALPARGRRLAAAARARPGALVAAAEKIDNLVGRLRGRRGPDRLEGPLRPAPRRRSAWCGSPSSAGWDIDHGPVARPAYARLTAQGADLSVATDEHRRPRSSPSSPTASSTCSAPRAWAPRPPRPRIGAGLGGVAAAAAWARAIEAARARRRFQRRVDGRRPASAHRAQGARRGRDAGRPRRRSRRGGPARRRSRGRGAPIEAARRARDLAAALAAAGPLAAAVDRFFVDVLVNADDPGVRARRYGLVREAAGVLSRRRRLRAGHRRRGSAVSSTSVGTKRVYDFSEGSREMRDLLGGKGANVAEMTRLGLPVPKGFTITTETCIDYLRRRPRLPGGPRRARSPSTSPRSRRPSASASATPRTRCWYRCAAAPSSRCPG